ncbi:hypothetical protein Hanom_Chr11g01055301 [Helianthus anomalus]
MKNTHLTQEQDYYTVPHHSTCYFLDMQENCFRQHHSLLQSKFKPKSSMKFDQKSSSQTIRDLTK